jgi:2-dehydro-3-deoxy-D-arabinonate dehydratase
MHAMKLYKTKKGNLLEHEGTFWLLELSWDELINRNDLYVYLDKGVVSRQRQLSAKEAADILQRDLLAPIGTQEVWAAGVTYLRSREARMEESKESGGATFYDKVYDAERPELFFKSHAHRVAATGEPVYIRKDSSWNVPEPELTLFINSACRIQGYTIGNDMSSRSIEGENPLYLPQAKVYERSAALGPGLYVPEQPIPSSTLIRMSITRDGKAVYQGEVAISQIKRSLTDLAAWLYREMDFNQGCFLMTGTCLVPPNDFTLKEKDVVDIRIDGIGLLTNHVAYSPAK